MEDIYKFKDNHSQWIATGIYNEVDDEEIIAHIDFANQRNKKLDIDGLLIIACCKGEENLIKKLLEMGANIEARSIGGSTPIMFLAQRDMIDVFKYFIENGANIFALNILNNDCIHYSIKQGKIYKFIMELSKSINQYRDISKILGRNKYLEERIKDISLICTTENQDIKKARKCKDLDTSNDKIKHFQKTLAKISLLCLVTEKQDNSDSVDKSV